MKIYNYHPITGEYIGESHADESPLEQGVYLIPACATEVMPPIVGEKEAAVFVDGAWLVVKDYRRTTVYDTANREAVVVEKLGTLPPNYTETPPPADITAKWDSAARQWIADLPAMQNLKWDEIKAAREAAGNAPIEYLGKLFDFDEKARNNLRDAVIAAQSASALSIPFPDVSWTLYDNTTATLTHTELLAFPLQSGIVRIGAVHAYARTLRDEIFKVGATVASVAAVKWAYTEGE